MKRRMPFLVFLVLLLAACSPRAQVIVPTPTASPSPTLLPTNTVQIAPALQTSTETPTAVPSSIAPPLVANPTVNPLIATTVAQLGPMGALTDISQYYHPQGAPLKIWRAVPIMAEATAGQEYPPFIYSYTAKATLEQANQYYASLAPTLGIVFMPGSGSAGTADQAVHNVTYVSPNLVIVLTSFDKDPGQVIVVISKAP